MSETATTDGMRLRLSAEIERRHRQPNLCTIYNDEAEGVDRLEQWITAEEGSFIDLSRME